MAESLSHKFGQLIGDLLEEALEPHLRKFAKKHKLYLDKKGDRKARTGKKVTWTDDKDNKHDLDFVLERSGTENKKGTPVAFIESAWRRGSRHSKNKVQEIQAAVNPIVIKHRETICFKGAILGGDFTKPSLSQLESDGFSVLYFPTELFEKSFKKFKLDIISDDLTLETEFARRIELWENFKEKNKLYKLLIKSNQKAVDSFLESLSESVSRYIERIIILPLHGEEKATNSVKDAIDFINLYSENKPKLPIKKYEIIIKYNTGDKIEVSFQDKKHAIKFLDNYL